MEKAPVKFCHKSSHDLHQIGYAYLVDVGDEYSHHKHIICLADAPFHAFLCSISIYIPPNSIFRHFTALEKIQGSARSEPSSNLNLAVLQVRFSVLPVVPLPFSSGLWFWKIPRRTGPNQTSATLVIMATAAAGKQQRQ